MRIDRLKGKTCDEYLNMLLGVYLLITNIIFDFIILT
jgi:hypothetical protein